MVSAIGEKQYNSTKRGVEEEFSLKELAKIQPFYDFYYPSEYSNEKISPDMKYFFENSHCSYIVGEKIMDRLALNKGSYGILTNINNVDYYNKIHTQELLDWEKNNPEEVEMVKKIVTEGK